MGDHAAEPAPSPAVEIEERINEEYKIWKKNTPFLYDLVLTHPLEWPSLTVQWLGRKERADYPGYYKTSLLLGTYAGEGEANALLVASVQLPRPNTEFDARFYEQENGEYGGFAGNSRVDVVKSFRHEGSVNRARVMPQSDQFIATHSPSGAVSVFDVASDAEGPCGVCNGLSGEGVGLGWSPLERGLLAACSQDSKVCVWQVDAAAPAAGQAPLHTLMAHSAGVEDVAWHASQPSLLGSVGCDQSLILWDLRKSPTTPSAQVASAHSADVNSLAFHPCNEFLLATASSDRSCALWDLRNLKAPLHRMADHSDAVMTVSWNPTHASIFATAGADRRVHVYDMSRIGAEQSKEDAEDGPPELLFIHGGHTNRVSDVAWNAEDPWIVASTAEDGILQIWQIAENIYSDTLVSSVLETVRSRETVMPDSTPK